MNRFRIGNWHLALQKLGKRDEVVHCHDRCHALTVSGDEGGDPRVELHGDTIICNDTSLPVQELTNILVHHGVPHNCVESLIKEASRHAEGADSVKRPK